MQLASFSAAGTFSSGFAISEASQLGFGRHLLEAPAQPPIGLISPTPGPTAPTIAPARDGSVVIFIQNQNAAYNDSTCLDSCSHGFTCGWQNAWVWMCHATNVVDHMWVWEPDGLIRVAANDSFNNYPELCLDMCESFSLGSGSCGLTADIGLLNVGYRECTAAANQVCFARTAACQVSAGSAYTSAFKLAVNMDTDLKSPASPSMHCQPAHD